MASRHIATVVIVIVSAMASTSASAGTAWAVARLTDDTGWVIAIDGLTTRRDGQQSVVCKLHQFGDVLFAAAGLTSSQGSSSYNAHRLMQTALSASGSLSEALEVFEDRAIAELDRIFRRLMTDAERQEQRSKDSMLLVLAAVVEDGTPRLRYRKMAFSESGVLRWEDGDLPPPDRVLWNASTTEAQRTAIGQAARAESPANETEQVIAIVKAAAGRLDTVGPPFSVAVLDASGPRWVDGYDQCANVQP